MQLAALKHPIICVTPSPRTLIRLRSRSFRSKKPSRVSDTRTICADRQEYSEIILPFSLPLSSYVLLLEFYFPAVRFYRSYEGQAFLKPVKVSESISATEYSMCSSTCFWLVEHVPSVLTRRFTRNETDNSFSFSEKSFRNVWTIQWQLRGVATSWNFKGKYRKWLPPGRACAACSCSAKCQRLFKVSRGGTVRKGSFNSGAQRRTRTCARHFSSWLEY